MLVEAKKIVLGNSFVTTKGNLVLLRPTSSFATAGATVFVNERSEGVNALHRVAPRAQRSIDADLSMLPTCKEIEMSN